MGELIKWVSAVLAIAAAGMFFAVGCCVVVDAYLCSGYESATGKDTKYSALRCYIKDGGEWYSWEEYMHRLATKGEFAK